MSQSQILTLLDLHSVKCWPTRKGSVVAIEVRCTSHGSSEHQTEFPAGTARSAILAWLGY